MATPTAKRIGIGLLVGAVIVAIIATIVLIALKRGPNKSGPPSYNPSKSHSVAAPKAIKWSNLSEPTAKTAQTLTPATPPTMKMLFTLLMSTAGAPSVQGAPSTFATSQYPSRSDQSGSPVQTVGPTSNTVSLAASPFACNLTDLPNDKTPCCPNAGTAIPQCKDVLQINITPQLKAAGGFAAVQTWMRAQESPGYQTAYLTSTVDTGGPFAKPTIESFIFQPDTSELSKSQREGLAASIGEDGWIGVVVWPSQFSSHVSAPAFNQFPVGLFTCASADQRLSPNLLDPLVCGGGC